MASRVLPARRGLAVSVRTFRVLAIASMTMLILIVGTGATVRLTASGLGCPHWPGCDGAVRLPEQGIHSFVEFGNRVIAAATIFLTLAVAIATHFVASLPRRAKTLAWFTFVGTLGQAPLGAITVYYHLNPWLVLSHFLLSLVVLTAAVMLVLETVAVDVGWAAPLTAAWVRAVALAFGAALAAMVFTGTLATAAGPHPGSREGVRRLGNFQDAIYVHVRATAAFGILLAVLSVALWRALPRTRRLLGATLGVLALVLVQMGLGELQYRTRLPWGLVLTHVTLAAVIWAAVVALVAVFFRPLSVLDPDA